MELRPKLELPLELQLEFPLELPLELRRKMSEYVLELRRQEQRVVYSSTPCILGAAFSFLLELRYFLDYSMYS